MSIDKRQEKSQRKGIDWDGLIENAEGQIRSHREQIKDAIPFSAFFQEKQEDGEPFSSNAELAHYRQVQVLFCSSPFLRPFLGTIGKCNQRPDCHFDVAHPLMLLPETCSSGWIASRNLTPIVELASRHKLPRSPLRGSF